MVYTMVKAVFGEIEIFNNERMLHQLMNISRHILKYEAERSDLREIIFSQADSLFLSLFHLIFTSQNSNIRYRDSMIKTILEKMRKWVFSPQRLNREAREVIQGNIHKLFDLEYLMQIGSHTEEFTVFIKNFLEAILKKYSCSLTLQVAQLARPEVQAEGGEVCRRERSPAAS